MTQHLLVGIGEVADPTEARQGLVDVVAGLRGLGVSTQVAAFADGPALDALTEVADVERLVDLREQTAGRVVESVAGRLRPEWGGQVHERRTTDARRTLLAPDCIHLFDVRAAALLRYLDDDVTAPLTVHVHPWDFSIAGLAPRDRRQLVERAVRFLTADESVVGPLLDAGVDPDRIAPMPDLATLVPPRPAPPSVAARARSVLGVPADRPLVALPPVAGRGALPDGAVRLAWELQRRGHPDALTFLWTGAPGPGEDRWPLDDDLHRSGVGCVRLLPADLGWDDLVALADVVVLPTQATLELPTDLADRAIRETTPVLCWDDHPRAAEVSRAGTVVTGGDLPAMADAVWSIVATPATRHAARSRLWSLSTAALECVLPLGVPVP